MNWLVSLLENFKFDVNSTQHEGRWRLIDPKEFDQKSFRRWHKWGKIKEPGISYIIGDLLSGEKDVQAIRFDKALWTEEKAAKWWNQNKDKFHKRWTEKDWEYYAENARNK